VVEQGLRCRATDPLGHAAATDTPPELGGADTAPTPGTLFRMAVGSCAATTLAMRAAQEGISLDRVEVVVSSESDHRGLLGIDRVQAGPLRLQVRYRLSAPGCRPPGCAPWSTGRSGTPRSPPPPAGSCR